MRTLAISLVSLLCVFSVNAQTMSLDDCIKYALEHNTNIQQRQLAEENQRISLDNTRKSRLPSLDASLGQGWGFGRSTGRDGSTIDRTSSNTSFSIGTSVPLFTGFRIPNQIKSEQYSLKAASENLRLARRNVSVQVVTYYLNALYYRGLVDVQRRQVELDRAALDKARSLYEAGKRPQSEVVSAEAQVALSEHSLTEAAGNEMLARLDLMQMLNLEGDVRQFNIVSIDTTAASVTSAGSLSQPDIVFEQAVANYPSILAAQYNLESSRYQLKSARSGYLPKLSLNAQYSNSYNYIYNMQNMSFSKQLDLNGSEYVGLSLSIPIFDRFQTRNSLRQARLNIESQNTSLVEARQSLFKEIQQAYWNAQKARDNFASAQKANASTSLAYQYEADRYEAGKGTAYDLQQARTRMEKAAYDELQAKFEYFMRIKVLESYLQEE
ncbi:MAG: TolC family protein [Bacteroidales bacterium]|nr:TolC family protein [Candidatus Liminaster caballi]